MRQLCKKCEISPCSLVLIHIGNESLDNRIRKRNQKCWLCRIKFVHSIFLVGIFRHGSFQKTFHQTRMEKAYSTFSGVHVKHELLIRSMFMNRNETGRCSWKKKMEELDVHYIAAWCSLRIWNVFAKLRRNDNNEKERVIQFVHQILLLNILQW